MAPTLTSNSFLFTTTPRSKLIVKTPKLTVSAEAFREEPNGPKKPFFDFGKLPSVKSLVPVVSKPSSGFSFGTLRRKDAGTVFVAGATGQAGIRIAQKLLQQGFTVRAGVPELSAAQELARFAATYKVISPEESKRLVAIESTFQEVESIAKTIGNASKVVVTIGPTENGPAAEVTTTDALQVIEASQLAGVSHVAIVYDTTSINVLGGISSFFNNLFAKSRPFTITEFLERIVELDVSYTLIKTCLAEDFEPESSYNVVVSAEGSTNGNEYKVSKSKMASLVADVFSNTAVAENKVVEVSTDPSAPLKTTDQLFSLIPEDGRRKAYAEALAKAKAEEEALKASEKASEAAEAAKKLQQEVMKLSEQEAQAASLAEDAQNKTEAAGNGLERLLSRSKEISADSLLEKAKDISSGWSWEKLSSQIAITVPKPDEKPRVQIATIRGQAKARTLPANKAVMKQSTFKPPTPKKPKTESTESKKEVRSMFGGLFKQETIYIDDD